MDERFFPRSVLDNFQRDFFRFLQGNIFGRFFGNRRGREFRNPFLSRRQARSTFFLGTGFLNVLHNYGAPVTTIYYSGEMPTEGVENSTAASNIAGGVGPPSLRGAGL